MGSTVFTSKAGSSDLDGGTNALSENNTVSIVAAASISANKVVCMTSSGVNYADVTQVTTNAVIGFSTGAVAISEIATIQTVDVLDGFTGLTTGLPIYLAASGMITQTVPTTGRLQKLGVALSATQININIQPPVYLS